VRLTEGRVWITGGLCIFFSALGFVCSKFTGLLGRLSRERGISLFFAAGLRNITAATTIAIEYFPEAAALPAILGIVFQQTLAAIMGRVLMPSPAGRGDRSKRALPG
jgi:tagaturonate reductase